MKKLSLIIMCLIFVFSLVACGGTSSPTTDSNDDSSVSFDTVFDSAEDTTTEDTSSDKSATTEDTNSDNAEAADDTAVISFSPVTAVDNDQCSITITDIEPDNMWGYTLKATLENKSADKTYMFSVYNGSVNGVQSDPFFAVEVAAGKKAVEEITFYSEDLDDLGIGDYTDIELIFNVHDSEDWTADYIVDEEVVHIYPYGEENATSFVREPLSTDTVLVDNEYATVIVTKYYSDDIWGYTAELFLVNKTDKELMFSVDEVSVNGFMADPFFATSVLPETCYMTSMSWSEETFTECGITTVEEIEFVLSVSDYNDWFSDDFVNETITLNP